MKPVESRVQINRPIEVCFAYLTDLANDVHRRREWIDAKKATDGFNGMGARYRLTGALLRRRIATEYETVAYEPNRLAAWKVVSGPLPLTFSRAFESADRGTRVTMRYEGDFGGLLNLAAPLLASMGRRQLEGDFPAPKRRLEEAG